MRNRLTSFGKLGLAAAVIIPSVFVLALMIAHFQLSILWNIAVVLASVVVISLVAIFELSKDEHAQSRS